MMETKKSRITQIFGLGKWINDDDFYWDGWGIGMQEVKVEEESRVLFR